MSTLLAPVVFFIIILLGVKMLRPIWPVEKHYPALERKVIELDAPLLLTHNEDSSDGVEAQAKDYTLSFDHLNNLGFMTYIMHVTRHDLELFPEGVTCDPFDPRPLTQNSGQDTTYSHVDVLTLGRRISLERKTLVRALFDSEHAERVLRLSKNNQSAQIRELKHDLATGDVTFTFYIKPRHLKLKRGHKASEHKTQSAQALGDLVSQISAARPKHSTPAEQWAALFPIISRKSHEDSRVVLTHILTHFDREPVISTLCQSILNSDVYVEKFVLFRHDPERFFGAISKKQLRTFVRDYTRDSDGVTLDHNAITPERFPIVFGDHLPLNTLKDSKIPTVYRIELVRRWLKDTERDRDALHEAIAAMSARDQLQLRAALESDSSLSGALSSTDSQAGKLTLDPSHS